MTVQLQGYDPTNTFTTTLLYALETEATANPYWTDDTVVSVMNMTDGYNIKVSIDLVTEADIDTSNTNGMCFAYEPTTNGGYCLTWLGDGTNAGVVAAQGFNVQYIPATSWSSTSWPGSSTGTILTPANSGITYYPDTT
jgi:hypothetical protein